MKQRWILRCFALACCLFIAMGTGVSFADSEWVDPETCSHRLGTDPMGCDADGNMGDSAFFQVIDSEYCQYVQYQADFCISCWKRLSEVRLVALEEPQRHAFGMYDGGEWVWHHGKCLMCGYACTHPEGKWGQETDVTPEDAQPSYAVVDEQTHRVTVEHVYRTLCEACGQLAREDTRPVAMEEPHHFDASGKCSECGYVAAPIATPEPTPRPTEAPQEKAKISDCTITVKNKTYTGKALEPAVTVKDGGRTLAKGTDYTVTYKNNKNVGTATATIKGKGNYTGRAKVTFKIKPKATTFSKLIGGKKKLTLKWKKVAKQITGYQIQYGTKKNFSNAKKLTVKGASTVKTTVKKLKSKKTYYVRIRTYKTVKGKKYYSAWSKAKKVKTK